MTDRPTRRGGITSHCVYGGFRMAREDWSLSEIGWECDYDFTELDPTIYPTAAECEAAIIEQHGAAS